MSVFILALFLIDFQGNLISEKIRSKRGKFITKPLLMPLLALYYITASTSPDPLVAAALICGFLGDVFLMLEKKGLFLKLGIASFMTGHILYIMKFAAFHGGMISISLWSLPLLIIYIIYGRYVYGHLYEKLGAVKIIGALYLGILLIMSLTSLTVLLSGRTSFIPVFLGSLSFIASDTILAKNIFVSKSKNADFMIMLTYVMAQFLIVTGLL